MTYPTDTKDMRMLKLAMAFWREAEAPSEDDIEAVFWMLIKGREEKLSECVSSWDQGVSEEELRLRLAAIDKKEGGA